MSTSLLYNTNNLQTTTIQTANINHHSSADMVAQINELAHSNASTLPYPSWPKKVIPIDGQLVSTTGLVALDQLEDTFRGYLTATNANLDVGFAGSTRRYSVLGVTKVAINRPNELYSCKFNVEFTCQPFGMDTSVTTLATASAQTTSVVTLTPTFTGSAPYQYPILTATITTIGGSPVSGTVSMGNNTTGQQVSVSRTWTSGDVLVIDSSQLLTSYGASFPVTVNGLPVTFSGALPLFPSGAASVGYSDSFASRTVSITVGNQARYM